LFWAASYPQGRYTYLVIHMLKNNLLYKPDEYVFVDHAASI